MDIRDCITCTFYRTTDLIPPENYQVLDVDLSAVEKDRYFYYRTEIVIGITRYIVRFCAHRNQIGEIIAVTPRGVEIAK